MPEDVYSWASLRAVKESTRLPLIVNGDIISFDSIDKALQQSGADGIMIGRGALGRPWFLIQAMHYLKTGKHFGRPDMAQRHSIMRQHLAGLVERYGDPEGARNARKHMGWYANFLPNSQTFRQSMYRAERADQMFSVMDQYFSSDSALAA